MSSPISINSLWWFFEDAASSVKKKQTKKIFTIFKDFIFLVFISELHIFSLKVNGKKDKYYYSYVLYG